MTSLPIRRRRILLFEAESLFRAARVSALRDAGYEVQAFGSWQSGIRALEQIKFDVVMVGDTVGECERAEMCHKIKNVALHTPVVLLVAVEKNPDVWADWFVDSTSGKDGLLAGVEHALHISAQRSA